MSMNLSVERGDTYEAEVQIESVVNSPDLSSTRGSQVLKGNKIGLVESKDRGRLVGGGLDGIGSRVAQDGGVDTAVEGGGTNVGERAAPVVVNVLVSRKLEEECEYFMRPPSRDRNLQQTSTAARRRSGSSRQRPPRG